MKRFKKYIAVGTLLSLLCTNIPFSYASIENPPSLDFTSNGNEIGTSKSVNSSGTSFEITYVQAYTGSAYIRSTLNLPTGLTKSNVTWNGAGCFNINNSDELITSDNIIQTNSNTSIKATTNGEDPCIINISAQYTTSGISAGSYQIGVVSSESSDPNFSSTDQNISNTTDITLQVNDDINLTQAKFLDDNDNGKIDGVNLTFSKSFDRSTFSLSDLITTGGITVGGINNSTLNFSLSNNTGNGNTLNLHFSEVNGNNAFLTQTIPPTLNMSYQTFTFGGNNFSAVNSMNISDGVNPKFLLLNHQSNTGSLTMSGNQILTFGFSKYMSQSNNSSSKVFVKDKNNSLVGGTININNQNITFTPNTNFRSDLDPYTFSLSSVYDLGDSHTLSATGIINIYDNVAPLGNIFSASNSGIIINTGTLATNHPILNLSLSGSDDTAITQMSFSCDNSTFTTPEAYATSKNIDLGNTLGCTQNEETKTIYVKFEDSAGNNATYQDSIIYDITAPNLQTQTSFGTGWYNQAQTSLFTFSDGGSGISGSHTGSCNITQEGNNQTCTFTPNICDTAGNCNTTPLTSNAIKLDMTLPTLTSKTTFGTGWYHQVQTSIFTFSDGESGISGSNTGSCNITQDGNASSCTLTTNICDDAGNCFGSGLISHTLKLDTTAPSLDSKTTFGTGWYNQAQISLFTFSDGGSGISGSNTGSCNINQDGNASSCTLTTNICDDAGNCFGSGMISNTLKLDTTGAYTGSVLINSGNTYTSGSLVSVRLSALDFLNEISHISLSCDNSTYSSYETYATGITYDLASGSGCVNTTGVKQLYVKFIDSVGNISQAWSDTIEWNTQIPRISFSASSGSYTQPLHLTLSGTPSQASIYYTLDGSTPTTQSGTLYTTGFTIGNSTGSVVLKAFAQIDGILSPSYEHTYTFSGCSVSSLTNGSVASYPSCTLSCNSGYSLSGNTCVKNSSGGGGGGGGGVYISSSSTTPTTNQNATQPTYTPVNITTYLQNQTVAQNAIVKKLQTQLQTEVLSPSTQLLSKLDANINKNIKSSIDILQSIDKKLLSPNLSQTEKDALVTQAKEVQNQIKNIGNIEQNFVQTQAKSNYVTPTQTELKKATQKLETQLEKRFQKLLQQQKISQTDYQTAIEQYNNFVLYVSIARQYKSNEALQLAKQNVQGFVNIYNTKVKK